MKARVVALAARVEQEIRSHPRLYDAFYRSLNSSPLVRSAVGRVKDRVRGERARAAAAPEPPDDPAVVERQREAARARLGLRP